MPLPALINYIATLPTLPASRADWQLDPIRSVVLVHDLQQYFVRPFAPGCPALRQTLEATAAILTAARNAEVPVMYTAQTGDQPPTQRGLQGELWGRGMTAADTDTAIVEQVAPHPGEVVLPKHRYSAFAHNDLTDRLRTMERDQMVITGVYAHVGITATALDAFQREVYPFVVADAVADFGLAEHERALEQIASCCGVVTRTDMVLRALIGATSAPLGGWETEVRNSLVDLLPEGAVAAAFAAPDRDMFELGLDSMRAFELLDRLLESGVDIDFGEFTRRPTASFLLEQGALLTET